MNWQFAVFNMFRTSLGPVGTVHIVIQLSSAVEMQIGPLHAGVFETESMQQ